MTTSIPTYKDALIYAGAGRISSAREIMDAIYAAGLTASEVRIFDRVLMTIEAAAEAA